MGKGIERLSALNIGRKLKPGYHADGGGLYLQVGKHGGKSWVFRFRVRKPAADAGRLREMGLGSFSSLALSEAREAARVCRKRLLEGCDPIEMKATSKALLAQQRTEEATNSKTFDECAEAYIASHEAAWRNDKHVAQWRATLKTYVSPHFGHIWQVQGYLCGCPGDLAGWGHCERHPLPRHGFHGRLGEDRSDPATIRQGVCAGQHAGREQGSRKARSPSTGSRAHSPAGGQSRQ